MGRDKTEPAWVGRREGDKHTRMLKVYWREVGLPDPLARILDARLEVVLDVFHEKGLGLACFSYLEALSVASRAESCSVRNQGTRLYVARGSFLRSLV